MKASHQKIIKQGERKFSRQIIRIFEDRKHKLLEQLRRLDKRQDEGWGYRKVWRKPHRVSAHKVSGHYAWLPVKRK